MAFSTRESNIMDRGLECLPKEMVSICLNDELLSYSVSLDKTLIMHWTRVV